MQSQELTDIYTIVLPKPNAGFETTYYEILDHGAYELDNITSDSEKILENGTLPRALKEIPKIGIDADATAWAKKVYANLIAEKKCVYDDEFLDIANKLPGFFDLEGSKQKMKNFLKDFSLTEFLGYLKGMPVYRLRVPNPAIPNYNMKGKGYYPENPSDFINFDHTLLKKCEKSLSAETKTLLSAKYLKPSQGVALIKELKKDILNLKIK